MSDLSPAARVVLAVLEGREGEPITLRELAYLTGPSFRRRDVELACQEIALAGWPIVSRTDGVGRGMHLASSSAAVHACIDALVRRRSTQTLRIRALRRTERRMLRGTA
jgi:hypothetical protein